MTSGSGDLTPGHRLLPPERRFAEFVLKKQQRNRTQYVQRMEVNYGREGIALLMAALAFWLAAAWAGFLGLVALLLSGGKGGLVTAGYCLLWAGIMLALPALARIFQASVAGRKFRNGRPLVKR